MPPCLPKVLRKHAIEAGWAENQPDARKLLEASEAPIRASALGALNRMGALAITDLVDALADDGSAVRLRALAILPTVWNQEVSEAIDLTGPLGDEDLVVVEAACFAAGECQPPSPAVVARLIEIATSHPAVLCRESAVAALGSLGDPAGAAAVISACGDKATVRRRAVLALVAFDGPEVDATLQRMASDTDWQVRQAAEELLAID